MIITLEIKALIKNDWEKAILSSSQIASKYGVTKNQVIGLAHNNGWAPRGPRNTFDTRMQTLEKQMETVLSQTSADLK